jgi:hypothetical protein
MTLVSALGGGLVCPGDKAGRVNKDLLMKTCDEEGTLMKPDRPITPNDLMFKIHEKPYVMDTCTRRGTWTWRYIVSVSFWPRRVKDASFTMDELGYAESGVIYDYFSGELLPVAPETRVSVPEKYMKYKYLVFAPYLLDEIALVGCVDKFITAARNLVTSVTVEGENVSFVVKYAKGKTLSFLIYSKNAPRAIEVKGGNEGGWNFDAKTRTLVVPVAIGTSGTSTVRIAW